MIDSLLHLFAVGIFDCRKFGKRLIPRFLEALGDHGRQLLVEGGAGGLAGLGLDATMDRLFVTSSAFDRIQVYDTSGALLEVWGSTESVGHAVIAGDEWRAHRERLDREREELDIDEDQGAFGEEGEEEGRAQQPLLAGLT